MANSTYKIRKLRKPGTQKGDGYEASSIAVPMEIARLLPEDVKFTAELTEEGILYRPMVSAASTELPSWIKQDEGAQTAAKGKAPAKASASAAA